MNTINEGATTKVHIKTFNQDIELYLNPTEGYLASEDTPLWIVRSDQQAPEGLQYTLVPNVSFLKKFICFYIY